MIDASCWRRELNEKVSQRSERFIVSSFSLFANVTLFNVDRNFGYIVALNEQTLSPLTSHCHSPLSCHASISIINDLYLDSSRCRIRCRRESFYSLIKAETMCHKRLQVDQSLLDKRDSLGICVVVAVLEAQIYLLRREVHEWDILLGFANSDHKH